MNYLPVETRSIYISNGADTGIAASDIPALKMFFGADSVSGITLVDQIGGVVVTNTNASATVTAGTLGWDVDVASGFSYTSGTLPTIGTKNCVLFGRLPATSVSSYNDIDIGDNYHAGAFDQPAIVLGGGVVGAYGASQNGSYVGHTPADVDTALAPYPAWGAVAVNWAAQTVKLVGLPGEDLSPSDTSGAGITDGITTLLGMLIPGTNVEESGPVGLLVFDSDIDMDLNLIRHGMRWFENNGSTSGYPPMWKGLA